MTDLELPFAGVEMGGTKCVCLLATGPGDIREEVRIPTTTPTETLAAIDAVLFRWWSQHGFRAIGVASFGPLELDPASSLHGTLGNTSKPGWTGANLLTGLTPFGVPVGLDTDVNGAALAEGRWGGAQGLDSYTYVTVGTGIGVGSVIQRHTVRGLGHSEAGHLRIPRLAGRNWPGACSFHGDCVEGLASGPAIQAQAGVPAVELPPTDPIWEEVVQALAALMHNLVLTTAPQRILIGGGVIAGQPFLLPLVRQALVETLNGYGVAPAIAEGIDAFVAVPALGTLAGPLGAVALARAAGTRVERPI
jgi:fructokinase